MGEPVSAGRSSSDDPLRTAFFVVALFAFAVISNGLLALGFIEAVDVMGLARDRP